MRVEHRTSFRGFVAPDWIRLNDVQSARGTSSRGRVDEDHEVEIVKQRHGEVETASAEIDDSNVLRQPVLGKSLYHLDTEGVIPQKDIADAGDQDARGHDQLLVSASSSGSTSSGKKKKRWPGFPWVPRS